MFLYPACVPSVPLFHIPHMQHTAGVLHTGQQPHAMVLTLLADAPGVRQWIVNSLGAIDLDTGAPVVRQLHSNPVSSASYWREMFNNPAADPDATAVFDTQTVHLHRLALLTTGHRFSPQWDGLWQNPPEALTADVHCDACDVKLSHETVLMFFQWFYTGELVWPSDLAECATPFELLVMASHFDVPFLIAAAEVALRARVTLKTCCELLEFADHHNAQQLKNLCLHVLVSGHQHCQQMHQLSKKLQNEVQRAIKQSRR